MRMPDVAGEELHRNARAHDAENARGIIFTGDTATPRALAFFADSSVPVVEKPFRPRALEDAAYRVVMAAGASTPSGASA
jgi:DNA-binding NtrC family response regulator